MSSTRRGNSRLSRRAFCAGATAALAGPAVVGLQRARGTEPSAELPEADIPGEDYRIERGRIRQSVMGWCYNPIPTEELMRACHRMGMPAMEGIHSKHYPELRTLGMRPAIVGSHGFTQGPLDRANHPMCIEKLRASIDLAAEFDAPNVITFTGMRIEGVTDEQAVGNCLDCWRQVIGYAEQKRVNLCLEHLNTRDSSHPMKGHPGYFGDDIDLCAELVRKIDSPRMKLLFDIYHVQIMNGDVIRRIGQYHEIIGHYHTAGVPGRGEIDDTQEINYPAVMRAILATGYTGFVAQEFIPTWPDKLAALRHGVRVCDV